MRLTNLRWPATASVFVCRTASYGKQGRLAFVDPAINSNTGAFDARAEMPNADAALRPGQFVRVILEGARRSNTIVVFRSAR